MAAPIDLFFKLPVSSKKKQVLDSTRTLLSTAATLGYHGIAVNRTSSDIVKEVEDKEGHGVPKIDAAILDSVPLCDSKKKLKTYSRLTVMITDEKSMAQLYKGCCLSYDITAAQPTNEKSFKQLCTKLPVDLITLDLTQRLPFSLRKKSISAALERGLYFEILYSPMLRDEISRRETITHSCDLVRLTNGKNIVISSGAEDALELRSPKDIANLAHLFGMSCKDAKDAVSTNGHKILDYAATRRSIKSVLTVEKFDDVTDQWVVDSLHSDNKPEHSKKSSEENVKKKKKKKRKLNNDKEKQISSKKLKT